MEANPDAYRRPQVQFSWHKHFYFPSLGFRHFAVLQSLEKGLLYNRARPAVHFDIVPSWSSLKVCLDSLTTEFRSIFGLLGATFRSTSLSSNFFAKGNLFCARVFFEGLLYRVNSATSTCFFFLWPLWHVLNQNSMASESPSSCFIELFNTKSLFSWGWDFNVPSQ